MTSAFVVVCRDGGRVRNEPLPAMTNGTSSWSARCNPTGTSACRYARASSHARLATAAADTLFSPNPVHTSTPSLDAISIISTLPGPGDGTVSAWRAVHGTSSRSCTTLSSRVAMPSERPETSARAEIVVAPRLCSRSGWSCRAGVIATRNRPPPAGKKP